MDTRSTVTENWKLLRQIRLAALLDTPTAFGFSYQNAAVYTDEQWKVKASSTGTAFWLAFENDRPVGMTSAAVSNAQRFNLIGMWVEPAARCSDRVFLDVSPDIARASNLCLKYGLPSSMDGSR